eukprot:2545196-Pleurochrysis_carterae.AAC.2
MTLVIRNRKGQAPAMSRTGAAVTASPMFVGEEGARTRAFSEAAGADGASGAASDDGSFESELNEPEGSSSSGWSGKGSGKRSSAYRSRLDSRSAPSRASAI